MFYKKLRWGHVFQTSSAEGSKKTHMEHPQRGRWQGNRRAMDKKRNCTSETHMGQKERNRDEERRATWGEKKTRNRHDEEKCVRQRDIVADSKHTLY